MTHPITPPPPHLLKKFSEQARVSSQKRGTPNYLKTFATLCIEWAMNSKPTPNSIQIRSSDITPPPELVQQWSAASPIQSNDENWAYELFIAHRAAQWGADQELEACCEWLDGVGDLTLQLRAARRPKPPSLKEQALEAIKQIPVEPNSGPWRTAMETIIRALEALPND
jgi:hypothetical protein